MLFGNFQCKKFWFVFASGIRILQFVRDIEKGQQQLDQLVSLTTLLHCRERPGLLKKVLVTVSMANLQFFFDSFLCTIPNDKM